MNAVFADTFYWIALADAADISHRRAIEFASALVDVPVVTTDEVLVEYLSFFATAHPRIRLKIVATARRILRHPAIYVVPQSRDSLLAGMALYEARPDKGYSLTDSISMQTMRREGMTQVLTNDRHFEQEGFRALFRAS